MRRLWLPVTPSVAVALLLLACLPLPTVATSHPRPVTPAAVPALAPLAAPLAWEWIPLPSPAAARAGHTATLLPGNQVLLAGGGAGGQTNVEVFDPAAGAWHFTAPMTTPRRAHTATLLATGQVLVVGGEGDGGPLAGAEIYDPVAGSWRPAAALDAARHSHTATLLSDGRVLVVGGQGADGPLAGAEIYDPATDAWSSAGTLLAARRDHGAALLPDGRVLVAGGEDDSGSLATAELYDPSNGTWATTGALADPRAVFSLTALYGGQVLAAGGEDGAALATAELYDPAAGTWSPTGALATARCRHSASLLPDGRVLVAGGEDASGSLAAAELYDPAAGAWSAAPPLATARSRHTATLLAGGWVLLAGGEGAGGPLAAAELFRFAGTGGEWQPAAAMISPRSSHTLTLLPDGRVLAAGGSCGEDIWPLAELYDPAADAWTATDWMAVPRRDHSATLLADGRVLVAGGISTVTYFSPETEIYDPATGEWSSTGSMQVGRMDHTATLLTGGRVLVAGGLSANPLDGASAEVYDPDSGTWAPTGSMSVARTLHAATLLRDGRVLVSGGLDGQGNPLASAELYDPATGTWRPTGGFWIGLYVHTATLLPDGRVLAAGNPAPDIYDPATGLWAMPGPMWSGTHYGRTATLLPDGRVLVTGGLSYPSGPPVSEADLYDPATETLSPAAFMATPRWLHRAVPLLDGRVLVAGGRDVYDFVSCLAGAELYDPLPGVDPAWRPALAPPAAAQRGQGLVLSGSGLRGHGLAQASGGATNSSPTNHPLLQLVSLANEQAAWLSPDPTRPFSGTAFASLPLAGFPPGLARLTPVVNGLAGQSQVVSLLNTAPAATADDYVSSAPDLLAVPPPGVLANDWDLNGDTLSAALYSAPAAGSVELHADGSFVYHRPAGFVGTVSFAYRTYDGASHSPPVLVTVSVSGTDGPPIARGDSLVTAEDATLTLAPPGVLANDGGFAPLGAELLAGPEHGSAALAPDGSLVYTPALDYGGTDHLLYTATGGGLGDTAAVTLTVLAVDDPARVVTNTGLALAAGTTAPLLGDHLRVLDVENPAQNVTYTLVAAPAHGTLLLDGGALAAGSHFTQVQIDAGRLSYAHDGSQAAADSLAFTAAANPDLLEMPSAPLDPDVPSDMDPDELAISGDGRYFAFASFGNNLAPNDGNGTGDVFVRDRVAGRTTRVSVSSAGAEGTDYSWHPALSADGRLVAFESRAANLVAGDTNNRVDLFVHDHQTGMTTRVSISSAGVQANADALGAALSADGRFVAFHSAATSLVTGDTNGTTDVFLHDRKTGETIRVSVSSAGTQAGGPSQHAALSADGRFVAFESAAGNLVAGDTNGASDVFLRDLLSGETVRVSVSSAGLQANGSSRAPSLSADGLVVAFESDAHNLVAGDGNARTDVFLHDRQSGETTRLSVSSAGAQANGNSLGASLSPDARAVAFESFAGNLVTGDTNGQADVFVHDLVTDHTERVSTGATGEEGDGRACSAALAAGGQVVAFGSNAGNLVAGDYFQDDDAFVRARQSVQDRFHFRINQPPLLAAIGHQEIDESTTLALTVTAADLDVPHGALYFSLAPGAPAGAALDPASGAFSWTPGEAQGPAVYTLTVTVLDSGVPPLEDSETFTVTVREVNSPPVARGDAYAAADTPLVVAAPGVLANDVDPDLPPNLLTATLEVGPLHSALALAPGGSFVYTPALGLIGVDVLTYTVSDGTLVDSAVVSITVQQAVADMGLLKTASAPTVRSGDLVTYTLSMSNAGPGIAPAITVTDRLPPQVRLLTISPACTAVTGLEVRCLAGPLPAGAQEVLTITVAVELDAGGVITNVAEVLAAAYDPHADNNRAATAVFVLPRYRLYLPLCACLSASSQIHQDAWPGKGAR